ncbi:MAG: beta-L-arabinofuranosidase domain-containing protein [Rikenellaceae bacterium]
MTKNLGIISALILSTTVASAQNGAYVEHGANSVAAVRGVGMEEVEWVDNFWKVRFDQCMSDIVPAQWDYFMGFTEDNFKIVGDGMASEIGYRGTNWQDGDYYKWLEAQISVYSTTKDPELLESINERAERIARCVAEDGYITLHTQIGYGAKGNESDKLVKFANSTRWLRPQLHETYNMGHFLVMAMTHHRVTGSDVLLNAAIRVGDYLDGFFDDVDFEKANLDYNSVHVMGLMELYRTTGEQRYLDCVNRIISGRGHKKGATQNQNDTPLREEVRAVGHAVLAPVLYIGAADYAAESGDEKLTEALKDIWEDIYTRKASITGGLGNVHNGASEKNRDETVHEAFGMPYSLSNSTAYNETCATFYGAFFSWRLFLLTGETKYVDTMERAFYNNLSSMALDGRSYFYTNVLCWHGEEHPLLSLDFHDRWTTQCTCVCCPTSVARFAAQTKEYAYAKDDNSLYVILYGSNEIDTEVAGNNVKFEQASNYPWSGDVTLSYMGDRGAEFDLKLRIPEWAQGATLCINGESVATAANSFATVSRKWKRGDKVELVLPMTPTLIEADPRVEQLRNQVAVTCGPLVYCLEAIDLPENIAIEDVMIPLDGSFSLNYQESLLGGVNTITTDALYRKSSFEQSGLYAPIKGGYDSIELTLIPYYAWANRGECEMTVFMPTKW